MEALLLLGLLGIMVVGADFLSEEDGNHDSDGSVDDDLGSVDHSSGSQGSETNDHTDEFLESHDVGNGDAEHHQIANDESDEVPDDVLALTTYDVSEERGHVELEHSNQHYDGNGLETESSIQDALTLTTEEHGDTIIAGGEDDVIVDREGASSISGAGGDDLIFTSKLDWETQSATEDYDNYLDESVDTVHAGSGEDTVVAATGDQVTLGEGKDVVAFFGVENSIADFAPEEDQVLIFLDASEQDETEIGNLISNIELQIEDGRLSILQGNEILFSANDVELLHIAFQPDSFSDYQTVFVGSKAILQPNIILKPFIEVTS